METEYDEHLGLTDEERAVVMALPAERLSHFVTFDDEAKTVETWARHMDTHEVYRTRVRPMAGMEIEFANARLEGRDPIIPEGY